MKDLIENRTKVRGGQYLVLSAISVVPAFRGGQNMRDEKFKEKNYYKQKITELVVKIENPWILEQILQFILNMTKED